MAAARRPQKRQFFNNTQGWVGVVQINRRNEEEGRAVAPGTRVFLTDEEVELTAQAPQRTADSPFELREIVHYHPRTGDVLRSFTAPQLEEVKSGSTPAGMYADGEEVGTTVPANA